MRYIDSGDRNRDQTLGAWLRDLETEPIQELRWQSGYFTAEGLAPIAPLIQALSQNKRLIHCVVGSNRGETTRQDIETLVRLLGCPRDGARIAIAKYESGLFHPKVYHATRHDGSQTAYVGSANLTGPAVTGHNIEAGLILDSAKGDQVEVLDEISRAIDEWLQGEKPGVHRIADVADIQPLVDSEVLRAEPIRRERAGPPGDRGDGGGRARLRPLLRFPRVPGHPAGAPPGFQEPAEQRPPPAPRDEFPQYVLIAHGAADPTRGEAALTEAPLPPPAIGLVMRLNRDSARHFDLRSGTANISLPVATMGTIQFGIFHRQYERPRAEFPLQVRYISAAATHLAPNEQTNIMVYGHAPGERGHGDIRMLMPAGACREIREYAHENGLRVPMEGDPMALEWPTMVTPTFRITFVDAGTPEFERLANLLANENPVGGDACWLRAGSVPDW